MSNTAQRVSVFATALLAVVAVAFTATRVISGDATPPGTSEKADVAAADGHYFKVQEVKSSGTVNAAGTSVSYDAIAGTLVVHPKDWDDVPNVDKDKKDEAASPEASMFYVAYFKKGARPDQRPVTFLFNGGPGSATVWLHMGAFGPKRIVTADDSHQPAAPYEVVNNTASLLDVSDLVFIDAPGAGFSRIAGKEKEKAFYGVDQDGHAFAEFILQFLSKYGRWNSPKYLFGESYGTTRAAVLSNLLETEHDVDLNGVIMLSQILNFDLSVDGPEFNPGVGLPYQVALPTYAASAWYHKKLPKGAPTDLHALLKEVQHYAMTDYGMALSAGAALTEKQRRAVAEKLHRYTGLPVSYILKADLRINGGVFEKNLQDDADMTTGRLDTRFSGPSMDPLSKEADYDPQSAAISSAYVSAFNDYVRKDLHYGAGVAFKPSIPAYRFWDFKHQPPGVPFALQQSTNVMVDLATAMKYNPNLKVHLHAGYYDLATPFYEGVYEMRQLPIPKALQKNISFSFYESGHMIYAHEDSLKALHDNTADFIRQTSNVK
ncbi:MAG: peptidase S10 [Alphaproteobacteria bacterium]|nr:peptidase S10 [Alphaproteobacteria bacterium]